MKGNAVKEKISWRRDNGRFRDGGLIFEGDEISLAMVSLQDSGIYYCSISGTDGKIRTASVEVQVPSV